MRESLVYINKETSKFVIRKQYEEFACIYMSNKYEYIGLFKTVKVIVQGKIDLRW